LFFAQGNKKRKTDYNRRCEDNRAIYLEKRGDFLFSKTKFPIEKQKIISLFHAAGIDGVIRTFPLGAGEFNTVYQVSTEDREYVIKIAPADDAPILTYEKGMMRAELRWYEQLREKTTIKVPTVYFEDFRRILIPTDYFIMEKTPGTPMNQMNFTAEEKAESIRAVARMAAQMHHIKNDRFGYIQNRLFDNWYYALHSMVVDLIEDAKRKNRESKNGKRLLQVIEKHQAVLEKVPCRMVNFDLWEANLLCFRDQGKIEYALVDPERTFWGDPIADFVAMEFMADLPQKKESLLLYNRLSETPILITQEERTRFTIMQGYLALLMETEKHYRYTPFHFGWWRNKTVSALLYRKVLNAFFH